jgi:hypothetical protein
MAMTAIVIPAEPFCFTAIDRDTGEELGGGKYYYRLGEAHDALAIEAQAEWQMHYPSLRVSIKEVTYREYCVALGDPDDWPGEYVQLLAEGELS